MQCWRTAFTQKGRNLAFAYFFGNGWSPWPSSCDPTFCLHMVLTSVWPDCCACSYTSYSQHWVRPTPLSVGVYAIWKVWLRQSTQTASTETLLHFFFKCQVTVTWLGFKTLFTKVSWWPFKWRCLPGFTANDTTLIDSPLFTVKDRCISTCQVKTNKSIALYQAGWQTTPCLLSSQAFPSLGPQKKMYIHQKSTKTTYQTLAMRTSRLPTRWQLKCVLGL